MHTFIHFYSILKVKITLFTIVRYIFYLYIYIHHEPIKFFIVNLNQKNNNQYTLIKHRCSFKLLFYVNFGFLRHKWTSRVEPKHS